MDSKDINQDLPDELKELFGLVPEPDYFVKKERPEPLTGGEVLDRVTTFFTESRDYNGLPVTQICRKLDKNFDEVKDAILENIQTEKIFLLAGQGNNHINQWGPKTTEEQIKIASSETLIEAVLYPSKKVLENHPYLESYNGSPYSLLLAQGQPQMEISFFDPVVLDPYRNDPRYAYSFDDITGRFCIRDKFDEDPKVPERDKVFMKYFGTGFDSDGNRIVAALNCDVARLSPEHQTAWHTRRIDGKHKIHPGYKNHIIGSWHTHTPVLKAIILEIQNINDVTKSIGRPSFFLKDFGGDRPDGFNFLLRPTLREFDDFCELLYKITGQNINDKFFGDDVPDKDEKGDKIGPLNKFKAWTTHFKTKDGESVQDIHDVLHEVRRVRQGPAHKISDNEYDPKLVDEQYRIIEEVHKTLVGFRHMLLAFDNAKPPKERYNLKDVWYR